MNSVKNENSAIYYSAKYWNDIPYVFEYICENLTGDKKKWWLTDFMERYCEKPYECVLSLNCGNGWVEREFIDLGIAKRIIAFDISFTLLKEAESKREGRNISYFQADVNQIDFKPDQFDLVINIAALHHVQYINRLSLLLGKVLKENGRLVAYDFTGPERNQYPLATWFLIKRFNKILPKELRRPILDYPHFPTMLLMDPTEAIHSNIILETLERYFKVLECHPAGGGIAYEILSQNPNLEKVPFETLRPYLDRILELDRKYSVEGKVQSLFSYFIATPNKERVKDTGRNERFQDLENKREIKAYQRMGAYHFHQYLWVQFNKVATLLTHQGYRMQKLSKDFRKFLSRR